MTAIVGSPDIILRNALKGMASAGSVAILSGAVSKIASKLGQGYHHQGYYHLSAYYALYNKIGSRTSTLGYGALGITAALALVYSQTPRISLSQELQDQPIIDYRAVPALVRNYEMDEAHNKIKDIAKGAGLAAAFGVGLRAMIFACHIAEYFESNIAPNGPFIIDAKANAFWCFSFFALGSAVTHMKIPTPLKMAILAGLLALDLYDQRTNLHRRTGEGFAFITLFMGLFSGMNMDKILGTNSSLETQFAIGQLLLGALASGTVGSVVKFSRNPAIQKRKWILRALAQRLLEKQLLQSGVRSAHVGAAGMIARSAILNLLQRSNVNTGAIQFLIPLLLHLPVVISEMVS